MRNLTSRGRRYAPILCLIALAAQRQLDDPETPAQLTCLGCHKY